MASLASLQLDSVAVDALAVAWLNRLSVIEMGRFLWHYPGPFGMSTAGYGVGADVARRIVAERTRRPDGFGNLDQVLAIRGVGRDKLEDLRTQAREALALAAYRRSTSDPALLWRELEAVGPGRPLSEVARRLVLISSLARAGLRPGSAGHVDIEFEVPFIALAWRQRKGSTGVPVDQFLRVRVEPWAFVVHGPAYRWSLRLVHSSGGQETLVSKAESNDATT